MENFQKFDLLTQRARNIFKTLVDQYLETGDLIGSKSLSNALDEKISPATIRNVLGNLEALGLLMAPHVSSGRLPTDLGLRFFVDGVMEVKEISKTDQGMISGQLLGNTLNDDTENFLERTGDVISQLTQTASLVITHDSEVRLRHIDFVKISAEQALVVMVGINGMVENRIFDIPKGVVYDDLRRSANFINAHLESNTLVELIAILKQKMEEKSREIDLKMKKLIDNGVLAQNSHINTGQMVVRGRSQLIEENANLEDVEELRKLFDELETNRNYMDIINLADDAPNVKIFIGSENRLFQKKGSALVLSPYMNSEGKIIGAVGVIAPSRLNFSKIVPMVTFTAGLVGEFMEKK